MEKSVPNPKRYDQEDTEAPEAWWTDPVVKRHEIPKFAWKRCFNDEFPLHQAFSVSPLEVLSLLPLAWRMGSYVRRMYAGSRIPVMDPISPSPPVLNQPIMGVPCGGIGGGCVNRGWRGDFARWSILPAGIPKYKNVETNQFSLWSRRVDVEPQNNLTVAAVLHANSTISPQNSSRFAHTWNFNGLKGNKSTYYGAFPLAWTVHEGDPDPDLRLICCQVSPVLPNEYKESSYPCTVFEWTIENTSDYTKEVSLMFSWQNGVGTDSDGDGGHYNRSFTTSDNEYTGVQLVHNYTQTVHHADEKDPLCYGADGPPPTNEQRKVVYRDPCAFAIATNASKTSKSGSDEVDTTYQTRFSTQNSDELKKIWERFAREGRLENNEDETKSRKGEPIGAALCSKRRIGPKETVNIVFSLAWDAPITRFTLGDAYKRRYTRFFGSDGLQAPAIASTALKRYESWRDTQIKWQIDIVSRTPFPNWYFRALFNELYYIVDGGTVWTDGPLLAFEKNDTSRDPNYVGEFMYLEGHEYLMANTYDVHFYASFALLQLWPKLQLAVEKDIARITLAGLPEDVYRHRLTMSGGEGPRCMKNCVPHDIGNPGEAPWRIPNSYPIHRVDHWKDLSPKFVLSMMRDYAYTKDKAHLANQFPAAVAAMERELSLYDRDGDGLIENDGDADSTYDVWCANGPSAYSGGLWVAASKALAFAALTLGKTDIYDKWYKTYESAQNSYVTKLWNGKYFQYDATTKSPTIQADQLSGQWYAIASEVGPIVEPDSAISALFLILENNVRKFAKGSLGAVNGFHPAPSNTVDSSCLQSKEVWTGVTYGVAATMIQHGLVKAGLETVKGMIHSSYEKFGYIYATPEALTETGRYRALTYMRPLAIWAMQFEWDRRDDDSRKNGEFETDLIQKLLEEVSPKDTKSTAV